MNSRGDMAITCTQSGGQTAQYTRTYFGLRCAGDTLGTVPVQGVVTELESTVSLLNLKADYSGTAMDPEDDDLFWSHSILSIAPGMGCPTHWQSWLARYEIDCSESSRGCYADCNSSTGPGVLDIFDFLCFGNSFDQGNPYACDCDTSTGMGVCDMFDFLCFGNAFAAGCP